MSAPDPFAFWIFLGISWNIFLHPSTSPACIRLQPPLIPLPDPPDPQPLLSAHRSSERDVHQVHMSVAPEACIRKKLSFTATPQPADSGWSTCPSSPEHPSLCEGNGAPLDHVRDERSPTIDAHTLVHDLDSGSKYRASTS